MATKSLFTCRYCSATFQTKSQRDIHIQSCKPTCDIQYSNMKVTLTRNPTTNNFLCKCSTVPAGHTFRTITGLQKHAHDSKCAWIVDNLENQNQKKYSLPAPALLNSSENSNVINSDLVSFYSFYYTIANWSLS